MKLLLVSLLVVGSVFGLPQRSLLTRKSTLNGNANNLGVYDGRNAKIEHHPYMASLLRRGRLFCIGTIIRSQWVLTSGECGSNLSPSVATVVVGSKDGLHGQKYEVEKTVQHPNYNNKKYDYDFSLIKTKKNIKWSKKVQPAVITKDSPKPGTTFSVAGWGDTSAEEVSESNGQLKEGNLTLLTVDECKDHYKGFDFDFTARMACAWNKGETTLCSGDWATGFPVFENGTYYVCHSFLAIGVEGYCTADAMPVIMSNCCTESIDKWINETIHNGQ